MWWAITCWRFSAPCAFDFTGCESFFQISYKFVRAAATGWWKRGGHKRLHYHLNAKHTSTHLMKTKLKSIIARLICAAAITVTSLAQAQFNIPQEPQLGTRFTGTVGTFQPPLRSVRPTLVVLIHGSTSNPDRGQEPSMFEAGHRPGTLAYSRFYFNFPFASAVLGVPTTGTLYTRQGAPLTRLLWANSAVDSNNPDNLFAFASNPGMLSSLSRRSTTALGFVNYNGALRVGIQARTVLQQIDRLYREYATWAGADPYLILVGHSKGGLVARYLMSVPTGTVAGADLTAAEENACRFLRDQTKFIVTLGTPHNGSPLADEVMLINQELAAMEAPINALWTMIRSNASAAGISLPIAAPINANLIRDNIGHPSDMVDLSSNMANVFNTGELQPTRMVRSNGVRVPMYCYGGRSPGDQFLASPRHDAGGQPPLNTTAGLSAHGLCALDWALHNIADRDWGTRTTVGAGKSLDLVRRTFSVTQLTPRITPPFFNVVRRFSAPFEVFEVPLFGNQFEGMPIYYMRGTGDGETDSDGMVAISSALAIGLSTTSLEPYDRTQGGQIYRMYGTAASPWAFSNHRTLSNASPMGNEVRRLVLNAGPRPSTAALSTF
jgi:hypothetical protein